MRKRTEAALRASEAHKSYLIKLSDALRPLVDPIEIQLTACQILGEHMGVNRVFYGDDIYKRFGWIIQIQMNINLPEVGIRHDNWVYGSYQIIQGLKL